MTDSDARPSTRTLGQPGTEADLLFKFDSFLAHRGPPGRVKAGACSRVRLLAATHPLQSTRLGRAVSARRTPWPARFMPVCTLRTNAAAAARMSSCCFFIFCVCVGGYLKFDWPWRGRHPVRSARTGSARAKDTCSMRSRLSLLACWLISVYTNMCRIYRENMCT